MALSQDGRIAGFYTLAFAALLLSQLPADMGKKLPRYPTVPAVRMGRLAVDQAFKGQGVGGALLADALACALRAEIAAYALVVDAKDEPAAAFYRHHGLIALPSQPMTLFLPLACVADEALERHQTSIPAVAVLCGTRSARTGGPEESCGPYETPMSTTLNRVLRSIAP